MKTLSLIPKKVKETYQICKRKDCISVHSPTYVNIDFDKKFRITRTDFTIDIQNDKCIVSLYLRFKNVHITIF